MSKYSIFATKEDYQKAYDKLIDLESKMKVITGSYKLDWTKIKRTRLDSLEALIFSLNKVYQRELTKKNVLNEIEIS